LKFPYGFSGVSAPLNDRKIDSHNGSWVSVTELVEV
jgi:hypothetical protein